MESFRFPSKLEEYLCSSKDDAHKHWKDALVELQESYPGEAEALQILESERSNPHLTWQVATLLGTVGDAAGYDYCRASALEFSDNAIRSGYGIAALASIDVSRAEADIRHWLATSEIREFRRALPRCAGLLSFDFQRWLLQMLLEKKVNPGDLELGLWNSKLPFADLIVLADHKDESVLRFLLRVMLQAKRFWALIEWDDAVRQRLRDVALLLTTSETLKQRFLDGFE